MTVGVAGMALLGNNVLGFSGNSIPDIPAVDIVGQQAKFCLCVVSLIKACE